jgi:signal transduction histidine kinase
VTIGSNLSLRITALLLGGFVVLQALVWAAMALPGRGDDRRPYNLPRPDQVAAMAQILDSAPRDRRAALIEIFNSSLYTVRVLREAPPAPEIGETALDPLRADYVRALPDRTVTIAGKRPRLGRIAAQRPRLARFFAPISVAVTLRGGDLLVIDSRPSSLVRTFLRQRAVVGTLGGLVILIILALAVRQTTRPLARMSASIRRFSSDLEAPDLPLTGPREVRELSRTFNEMKVRITGLMSERTRVLAAVAHDMRTYLTRLRLRAEFIDDAEQRGKAAADLDEMAALLDDTLMFARQDAGAGPGASRLDLSTELRAITDFRREMGDAVVLSPPPEALAIRATPLAFRRMLQNLIDNGLRHGGRVTLSAERDLQTAIIRVADDGPGVPADALHRLGEPFGRLEPSRDRQAGGAGLGLAIVRALAERDGAQVAFANGQGGGFVVTLRFPLAGPD